MKEARQAVLINADLAMVDKLNNASKIFVFDVFQDDDWVMPGTQVTQHLSEVGGAGRQDNPVSIDSLPSLTAGQSTINEVLTSQEILEGGSEAVLVVVPLEAVLLLCLSHGSNKTSGIEISENLNRVEKRKRNLHFVRKQPVNPRKSAMPQQIF